MKKVPEFVTFIFLVWILVSGCGQPDTENAFTLINLSHLEHLSEEVVLNNRAMEIVHIYSEYPDYDWVEAEDEGIACVDDVARAAVFYLRHFQYTNQKSSLEKAQKLLEFLFYMQAPNGLFYNFINSDLTINKKHFRSMPRAGWWSWRAIWAMSEAYVLFKKISPDYAARLSFSIKRTFPAIDSLLHNFPQTHIKNGLNFPIWLPSGTASDQAAVIILALVPYINATDDTLARSFVRKLGTGITKMQVGDSLNLPYGSFLSWENIWHAWGNSQSVALLVGGKINSNNMFIHKALNEVKFFYPFLMRKNYLSQFRVKGMKDSYQLYDEKQFPQIAYGIRPMVWASLRAYEIFGKKAFAEQAGELACWLFGKNITGQPLYDPRTGRCYDGIINSVEINKNSGAESTIEALMTILEIEKNPLARNVLHNYYKRHFNQ